MIKKLDLTNFDICEKIIRIQQLSYQIEANIIEYQDIPRLKDTRESIQLADEIFFGFFNENQLVGIISFKIIDLMIDIHRLAVHPDYFKHQVATQLIGYVENLYPMIHSIEVNTGKYNIPAVNLYLKLGYHKVKDYLVDGNLWMTLFKKNRREIMKYQEINADTINRWIEEGWAWGVPISHDEYVNALNGVWQMLLTPTKPVPKTWYPNLKGIKVLGLASGGGQQMPIFAALGAECTVLDYSSKQIESERLVAKREGYQIDTIQADMTLPLPFLDESFDLIFHPVSNCYIEDVNHVWNECYRILKKGGRLLAGLDNGFNFLFDDDEKEIRNKLPFNPLKNPALMETLKKNDDGVQFSHTIDEQIGGQLKAGFRLLDIYEDTNGYGLLHEHGVPTFYATLAIKD